jgi:hypothetical protein
MTHKSPRLQGFRLEAITKYLKAYLKSSWGLSDINTKLPEGDQVLATSTVSCVHNDLLTHLCDLEIGIGAKDLADDAIRVRLE